MKGFAAFFVVIIVLSTLLVVAFSFTFITVNANRNLLNTIKSTQAYYASEAGIEDSLLRILNPDMDYSGTNSLVVGSAQTDVTIEKISTSLIIESRADNSQIMRNLEVRAQISSDGTSFHYGVQVGEGGLTMDGNSRVNGNIYSNGPISGASNTKIYGDIYSVVSIDSMKVYKTSSDDGNAYANTITDCNIENGAYYQNISGTSADAYYPGSPDPEIIPLPINEDQIASWKEDAVNGGTISSYYLGGNDADFLGPTKVNGDFEINSNAQLTQTGTIWVTGDIILDSNAVIELSSSYGSDSGIIIADGKISLSSNVAICGSEGYDKGGKCFTNEGSFLMILSTNNSLDPSSPAIEAVSNSKAAILYTNNGMISLDSNAELKEITGYALHFDSNAEVTYESGLADIRFKSGPGGGWSIVSWKEVE